jgi:hypothetical protein
MPQTPRLTGEDSIDFRIALFRAAEAAGIPEGATYRFSFSAKREEGGVSISALLIEDAGVPSVKRSVVAFADDIEWADPPGE